MGKRTPWYPGSMKPARAGWYEVRGVFAAGRRAMRFWDAGGWMWAPYGVLAKAAVASSDEWRGLTKPAKDAEAR